MHHIISDHTRCEQPPWGTVAALAPEGNTLNIDKDRSLLARVAALRSQYPTDVQIDHVLDLPHATKSWSGVFTTGAFQSLVRHQVGDDFRTVQAHGTSRLQMPSVVVGQGDAPIVLRDERPLTPRHKQLTAGCLLSREVMCGLALCL